LAINNQSIFGVNMSKRLKHPKGPANMKANYLAPIMENGEAKLKLHKGFTGFNGWLYHPTKGFKKMSGFKPQHFRSIAAPVDEQLLSA
jgi:hypothetical protein